MKQQLTDLQRVLQVGNTITAEDAQRAAVAISGVNHSFRMAALQIGKTFAMLCETFATVDMEHLPAPLREQIEAVVLGRDLPPADTTGPVTPIELLQIAHRMTAVGDYDTASRLRRLADDLVAKPSEPGVVIGWDRGSGDATTVAIGVRRPGGAWCITTIEAMVDACFAGGTDAGRKAMAGRVREYFIGLAQGERDA